MWSLVKLELSSVICVINNIFKTGHSVTLKQEQISWNNNEVMVGLDLEVGKDEQDSRRIVDYDDGDDLVCTLRYNRAVHFAARGQAIRFIRHAR
jgi:hypothetical protein